MARATEVTVTRHEERFETLIAERTRLLSSGLDELPI